MSRNCILVVGLDQNDEYQLQRQWFSAHLKVPLLFRRTGEGALTYLAATQNPSEIAFPRPLLVIFNWPLADMPARQVVKEIRSERRLRELLIIACHPNWELIEQRLAYNCGVDCCVDKKDDFSELLRQLHRAEDFWFREPVHHHP
jgi:hypothetical protein